MVPLLRRIAVTSVPANCDPTVRTSKSSSYTSACRNNEMNYNPVQTDVTSDLLQHNTLIEFGQSGIEPESNESSF